ncbi:hypothetical protein EV144_101384 [Flavobacterium sp. 270]|uniref:hypothetical protein n=1 Tax=Flavobacterium sp. 270 TaxID=2512114 RepID=UPI0010669779|nr:hypothetical protein [Flavobacterium sp. 270]TDW51708.1 hypothetical protein EV144_101384 [Flavobacterium sp. 270]
MKTSIKISMIIFLTAITFSCKKSENAPTDNYSKADTINVDTIGPTTDSVNVSTTGTTGATGEGSTGSGSARSVQKGTSSVDLNAADSTTTNSKAK